MTFNPPAEGVMERIVAAAEVTHSPAKPGLTRRRGTRQRL